MTDEDEEFATVSVTVTHEIEVPVDIPRDGAPDFDALRDRAEDWFWNYWRECLTDDPGPSKEQVSVDSVVPPRSAYYDGDGNRICTECGTSVEDEPYELWLFHICRECATGSGGGDHE